MGKMQRAEAKHRLELRFWGVRGSMPTPAREFVEYGGNTPCLEIRTRSGQVLVFDAGTGIRKLGLKLTEEFRDRSLSVHLFLTHYHWDHIQGLPFFAPGYSPGANISVYSWTPPERTRRVLEAQTKNPYFPIPMSKTAAAFSFCQLRSERLDLGDVSVLSFPLNHPQGAYGYRIESDGASIVYASDLEHGVARYDTLLRDHAAGANVLVYDAQYTEVEYQSRRGWGHSTSVEATRVARDAKVRDLFLFHHDPEHTDAAMKIMERNASALYGPTRAARDGMVVCV